MSALRFPKQERFCHEYVKDLDGRAAAIRAGYVPGPNNRASIWRLLRNGGIQARIAELQEAIAKQAKAAAAAHAEAGWVVAQLVKIARADPRKLFHADGTRKKVHELGDAEAAALSGFGPPARPARSSTGSRCLSCSAGTSACGRRSRRRRAMSTCSTG